MSQCYCDSFSVNPDMRKTIMQPDGDFTIYILCNFFVLCRIYTELIHIIMKNFCIDSSNKFLKKVDREPEPPGR